LKGKDGRRTRGTEREGWNGKKEKEWKGTRIIRGKVERR
jgi:hypothetical protein